jgi:hypothetical protein
MIHSCYCHLYCAGADQYEDVEIPVYAEYGGGDEKDGR